MGKVQNPVNLGRFIMETQCGLHKEMRFFEGSVDHKGMKISSSPAICPISRLFL